MLGIGLNRQSFSELKTQPWSVIVGMVGQLIILPAIAFLIAYALNLPPIYFLGLILIACCPGGSSSNVFTMLAKGNVALSITLTACSSIITLFTIPLILSFTSSYLTLNDGFAIQLPVGKLMVQNILLVFVPMVLGVCFRHWKHDWAMSVHRVLKKTAFPALMLLAALFFLQYTQRIINDFTTLGLATTLLILGAMGVGQVFNRLFRFSKGVCRTINIEIGMQNAAQAIAIATSPYIFNNPEIALPAIIYALMMNIILLIYVGGIRKKEKI